MTLEVMMIAAFALTTGLVFFVGHRLVRLAQDPVGQRLASAQGGATTASRPLVESLAGQLPQLNFDPSLLDQELRRAGYYKPTARKEFYALRNALVILAVIAAGAVVVAVGPEREQLAFACLMVGLAAVGLCWGLPRIFLKIRGRRRVERIRRALPDALDMTTMCLTGGLSLPDALTHVSREIYFAHPDLAVEFMIIRQQADMMSLDMAFRQFAQRIDGPEILAMAALISHGQRLGTNIVTSVRDYADNLRLKRRQANDERSNKAAAKLLFPVVICLLPAVFIVFWGPAIMELWSFVQSFEAPVIDAPPPPF